jgi:exodeoxyribonuclease-5
VAFAKVVFDDACFAGIADADGLLPRVPGVDSKDGRKTFAIDRFADWRAVLEHWRSSLRSIAREVKAGDAAVRFAAEQDLKYCDVLPLLRLPERQAQWETFLAEAAGGE